MLAYFFVSLAFIFLLLFIGYINYRYAVYTAKKMVRDIKKNFTGKVDQQKGKQYLDKRKLVYFLCTGNSCRSQMAHGFLNALGSERFDVLSAGIKAHGLNPRAVQVVKEVGIDISGHTSDVIDTETLEQADIIITLCSHADDNCPVVFTNAQRWHWGFDDPAKAQGSEAEVLDKFRLVRDEVKARVEQLTVLKSYGFSKVRSYYYIMLREGRHEWQSFDFSPSPHRVAGHNVYPLGIGSR